jgi:hypothetical protein
LLGFLTLTAPYRQAGFRTNLRRQSVGARQAETVVIDDTIYNISGDFAFDTGSDGVNVKNPHITDYWIGRSVRASGQPKAFDRDPY